MRVLLFFKKGFLIFSLSHILFKSYAQEKNNSVIGYSKKPDSTKVFLQKILSEPVTIDSTYLVNGFFKFKIKNINKFYASIKYENVPGFIPFLFTQSTVIKIIDTGSIYKITNSRDNFIMDTYYLNLSKLFKLSNEKIAKSLQAEKSDTTLARQLYQEYLFIEKKEKLSIRNFILKNKKSFSALIILYNYKHFFNKSAVGLLLKELEIFKLNEYYKDLYYYSKSDIKYLIGKKIENVCGVDINNKKICINDINSVILLDFWATWCKPCLLTNDKINSLGKKYDKVKIIRFSIDNTTTYNKWKEAVGNETINFVNLNDISGWNSEWLKHLGITEIPFFILIDKQKRIRSISSGTLGTEVIRKGLVKLYPLIN